MTREKRTNSGVDLLVGLGIILQSAMVQAAFVHPGILHSRAELDRIKAKVAASEAPWLAGYNKLTTNSQAGYNYTVQGGFTSVGRGNNPGDNLHKDAIDADCNAAHYNAIRWYITGDQRYANKAIQILNAYSYTLESIIGTDKILMASLNGAKFLYAAEIIRHTNAGWSAADIAQFESMMLNIFYPIIQDFATFANGNWSTGCVKTMMAIGVFCNNQTIFDRAVNWYYNGTDNGSLTNYIINEAGQCQESGRDQGHAQLGIAHLAEACEIGWNQGLDMYAAVDNRLLKGFEYTAQYNLGYDVPFVTYRDKTGKYYHTAISSIGRGAFRAIYEMVYNHYKNRRGISCPYTEQVVGQIRPEDKGPYADCCGYGTLLFVLPPWTYGDFTGDGTVDLEDMTDFFIIWLETDSDIIANFDVNSDDIINLAEFARIVQNWL
jgi:hypothetical protein